MSTPQPLPRNPRLRQAATLLIIYFIGNNVRPMDLADILPASTKIAAAPSSLNSRAVTYLATYSSIRALGAAPGAITLDRFNQLIAMVYGWMPRVMRIDLSYVSPALMALNAAQSATTATYGAVDVDAIANCLRSLVGASKALHFVNDDVFPIWDSNVETFQQRVNGVISAARPLPYNYMTNVANYRDYVMEVHAIRAAPGFSTTFLAPFIVSINARLSALGIAPYPISDVRAIEAAAFELA